MATVVPGAGGRRPSHPPSKRREQRGRQNVSDAHLPQFLLPKSRGRREDQLSYPWTNSDTSRLRWRRQQPHRPKSAAHARDIQRRRRMREVNKPSSMTSRTSARHRNIIQLSVGIEQLLKKPEGEERVVATLSVCLAKLSVA